MLSGGIIHYVVGSLIYENHIKGAGPALDRPRW